MKKCNEAAKSSNVVTEKVGITLNNCSKEDWGNAWGFRQQLQEWLMEKGGCPDTEMMTLWVGYDFHSTTSKIGLKRHGRDIAIKVMPNDANGEMQALWDLYILAKTEDEFIEKFKVWRNYLRQRQAVDDAENVVNISDGETL